MSADEPLNNWLCKIGIHKWDKTWHVTHACKVALFDFMNDFWTGYHKCTRCNHKKERSEFVHSEPLDIWERQHNE